MHPTLTTYLADARRNTLLEEAARRHRTDEASRQNGSVQSLPAACSTVPRAVLSGVLAALKLPASVMAVSLGFAFDWTDGSGRAKGGGPFR